MEATLPENHHPTNIPPFERRCFSFPIDVNFGLPCKTVSHPYQHKYWNVLLLDFHYHSIRIKFPKIKSFLSIQLANIFFSFSQTFLYSPTQLFEPFVSCLLIYKNISLAFLFDLQLCVFSFPCNHTLIYKITNVRKGEREEFVFITFITILIHKCNNLKLVTILIYILCKMCFILLSSE